MENNQDEQQVMEKKTCLLIFLKAKLPLKAYLSVVEH